MAGGGWVREYCCWAAGAAATTSAPEISATATTAASAEFATGVVLSCTSEYGGTEHWYWVELRSKFWSLARAPPTPSSPTRTATLRPLTPRTRHRQSLSHRRARLSERRSFSRGRARSEPREHAEDLQEDELRPYRLEAEFG